MHSLRVAVIGAGIGGLTAALALKQRGHIVTVFEKHSSARNTGAGLTLWSNAAYALDQLGVLSNVLQLGNVMKTSQIRTSNNRIIAELPLNRLKDSFSKYPSFCITRTDLHNFLINSLGEVSIQYEKQCCDVEQTDHNVTVRFADDTTVKADLVLACDGIHSVVREQLLQDHLRYSGYTSWRGIATFHSNQYPPDMMYEFWGTGLRFGFVPLREGQVYWFATQNAEKGMTQAANKNYLKNLFENFPELVRSTINNSEEAFIIKADIYDRVPVRSFINGRIVLIGDAAHPMTPNLGQGACMAIEDAVVFGKCVQHSPDVLTAIREYDRLRVDKTSKVVHASWKWGKMAQLDNGLLCRLRNKLVRLTPSVLQNRQWMNIIRPDRSFQSATRDV